MRNFKKIQNHVVEILIEGLPPYLTYHCVDHTLYVLNRAEYIGIKEKIGKEDMFLLKVASLYHDIGFIHHSQNHEDLSCEIAQKELKVFEFHDGEIDKICGMIQATCIPQKPQNHLENILADADLEYLATNRFFPVADRLYRELLHFNPELTLEEWNNIQVKFISSHHYHTRYCRQYKERFKQKNLKKLLQTMKQKE